MSHTLKLLIGIALGGLAGIVNWTTLSQRTRAVQFASLSKEVAAGDIITTDMIVPVSIEAAYAEELRQSVIPWNDRSVLSGKTANRTLKPGVLLLWDNFPVRGPQYDLREDETAVFIDVSSSPVSSVAVGENISFRFTSTGNHDMSDWVGPFRVVTVGEKRIPGETVDRVRELSVAIPEKKFERHHTELLAYIDRQAKGDALPLQIRAHISD